MRTRLDDILNCAFLDQGYHRVSECRNCKKVYYYEPLSGVCVKCGHRQLNEITMYWKWVPTVMNPLRHEWRDEA